MSLSLPLLLLFAALAAADCPSGMVYEPNFKKCYKFFNASAPFIDAEQTCNSIGGHLVAIQNAFENSYVDEMVRNNTQAPGLVFWIGANDYQLPNKWSWTANVPMVFTNWASHEPEYFTDFCAFVELSSSEWKSAPCVLQMAFVCEADPSQSPPCTCTSPPCNCPTQSPPCTCTSPPCNCPTQSPPCTCTSPPCNCPTQSPPCIPASSCPKDTVCTNGYSLFPGNCLCYKYFTDNKTYSAANATCAQNGGILATSNSPEVNEFLTVLPEINHCQGSTCPYIGIQCTSSSSNSCKWADGSPLGDYSNFVEGAPHNGLYSYTITAATVANQGDWEWINSNDARTFICQKASTRAYLLMKSSTEKNKEARRGRIGMKNKKIKSNSVDND